MTPLGLAVAGFAAALSAAAMEPWAALLHRRLWHGPWWAMHRSHHRGRGDTAAAAGAARVPRGWQANDALSLMHAPPAAALIAWGLAARPALPAAVAFGVGAGMSLFGLAYLVVHDGFVHQRLPLRRWGRWRFMRRVQAAHILHHRTGGAPYGLFASPWALGRAGRGSLSGGRGRGGPPGGRPS